MKMRKREKLFNKLSQKNRTRIYSLREFHGKKYIERRLEFEKLISKYF